jgi:hypothetical protein
MNELERMYDETAKLIVPKALCGFCFLGVGGGQKFLALKRDIPAKPVQLKPLDEGHMFRRTAPGNCRTGESSLNIILILNKNLMLMIH